MAAVHFVIILIYILTFCTSTMYVQDYIQLLTHVSSTSTKVLTFTLQRHLVKNRLNFVQIVCRFTHRGQASLKYNLR